MLMTAEYIIGKATVRMHGKPDQEKIRAATERFLKQVEASRKRKNKKE
jgi:hypothetical protein